MLSQFITDHLHSDIHRLLLSARNYPGIDMPYAVSQIEALRKIKDKVPSWYSTELRFPPALSVEQSSSEAAAQFKVGLFQGDQIADLTGGMGIDSYFWAKSFKKVHYIEQSELLAQLAQHNFEVLNTSNITVHPQTAEEFLAQNTSFFDLVYIDPARRDQQKNKVFNLSDCTPDITVLQDKIFEHTDKILIKTAPMLDMALAIRQLRHVVAIWIVALHQECREVLYLMDKHTQLLEPRLFTINLNTGKTTLDFTRSEEQGLSLNCSMPQQFLYEPDAAILKSGAFKVFGARFGLASLHTHTHLYTSAEWVPDVPGRSFKIKGICKYEAGAVKNLISGTKANIAVRNFPDKVPDMYKKLKLSEGGDWYLFGVTLMDDKKAVLVCEKTA